MNGIGNLYGGVAIAVAILLNGENAPGPIGMKVLATALWPVSVFFLFEEEAETDVKADL